MRETRPLGDPITPLRRHNALGTLSPYSRLASPLESKEHANTTLSELYRNCYLTIFHGPLYMLGELKWCRAVEAAAPWPDHDASAIHPHWIDSWAQRGY